MLKDQMKLVGKLSIAINNKVVQEINNLVVTTGKNFVASRIKDATSNAMSHMAIGTGSTSPAAGDTTLGTETARVALTSTTVTNADVAYVSSFGAGTGTGAITEAGLFNASSAGTLFCRTTFSVVNKGADDSMTITWTVTVS
ncbi:MAG: hypothetical protein CBD88_05055 [Flavobacteriales bacterium TMED228]|nr:MAG: hypothetical protein CBD88_05055 [Flavobacteriales bacterium TMED228]|tara:strand:- start:789 stop:1214 length:426 start_codon:yes stop_codon:yes gene_type:complete